jgi:hypothetical protein
MLPKVFDLVRVRRKMVFGKGAQLVATSNAGAETVVDMTELATMGGVTASAAELNIMDGCTATAAEINMAADNSANVETVAATNVIGAAESGKTFFLNHATEFVSTLPAVAAGLRFTFIVSGAPSGASYTVVTDSSANLIVGHVLTSEDAGGSADSETTGGDTITFVDGKAVVGDRVDLICDGTNWFAQCSSKVFDAITISAAS